LFEELVGSIRANRPPMTTRQLQIKRKKPHHQFGFDETKPLFLDNIWPPEPTRDDAFGNSRFKGNCSGTVCKQILWR
jgi:hypothetical protein